MTVLLGRHLAVLLLFLTPDCFLNLPSPLRPSLLLTHAVSTPSPITRPRILFVTDGATDEEDYDGEHLDNRHSPPRSTTPGPAPRFHQAQLCEYDPCKENQEPCAQLSLKTGCLCPGLSGANQRPHAPHLRGLVPANDENGRDGVEVQWCAPSSVVSGYRVVVEGSKGQTVEFGHQLRHGLLGPLEAGTKVCVEAVNAAGNSATSEYSCMRFKTPESLGSSLQLGVIVGVVAILLFVLIVALIVWRCRACRNATGGSAEGLGNPSYSTEGNL